MPDRTPLEQMEQFDSVCDAFDRAWQNGDQPRLEDHLYGCETGSQQALFSELLKVELEHCCHRSPLPTREEYEQRFPNLTAAVDAVFRECVDSETQSRQELAATVVGSSEDESQPTTVEADTVLPTIPGYQVLELIGGGGMGLVYRARNLRMNRIVAIKIVRPDASKKDQQRFAEMFEAEIQAAAKFQHKNVVQAFHASDVDGRAYLEMEYVNGESLEDCIRRSGRLSGDQAAECLEQIANVVHEAHAMRMRHRDIKPANILFDTGTGIAKIADFGLALTVSDSDETQLHAAAGTTPYMAPELFQNRPPTVATEVYALGATLYEVLTGKRLAANPHGDDRNLEFPAGVDSTLARICRRCLDNDPEKRLRSAAEVAAELRGFVGRHKQSRLLVPIGKEFFGMAFVMLAINLSVFALIQRPFSEPLVWALIFSMYGPVFFLLSKIPTPGVSDSRPARIQLWTLWIGKLCAAACICAGLRLALQVEARDAILMAYPMFAGLSGMLLFAMAPQFWNGFYWCGLGYWLLAGLMVLNLELAPLEYAFGAFGGVLVTGLYVQQVSQHRR